MDPRPFAESFSSEYAAECHWFLLKTLFDGAAL
jgi:hypothetical protein